MGRRKKAELKIPIGEELERMERDFKEYAESFDWDLDLEPWDTDLPQWDVSGLYHGGSTGNNKNAESATEPIQSN